MVTNAPKDKEIYNSPFSAETFYTCRVHNVPYPRGSSCPVCDGIEKSDILIQLYAEIESLKQDNHNLKVRLDRVKGQYDTLSKLLPQKQSVKL